MVRYLCTLLGALVLGLVADTFGRLKALFPSLVIVFLGGLTSAFTFQDWVVFNLLRGFAGFGIGMWHRISRKLRIWKQGGSTKLSRSKRLKRSEMTLSSGQTDSQVVASGRKLNLRRDLRWVAKRTRKFPHKYTQVEKNHLKADISCISLANNRLMDVAQLALTWVGWPNGEKLALTCVQIWSWPKWAQVNASTRKPWPNGVASRPKFSTCVYLRVHLARALLNQWRQKCSPLQIIPPKTQKTWGRGCFFWWADKQRELIFYFTSLKIVWTKTKAIIEFGFRRIRGILQIVKGVIHLVFGLAG